MPNLFCVTQLFTQQTREGVNDKDTLKTVLYQNNNLSLHPSYSSSLSFLCSLFSSSAAPPCGGVHHYPSSCWSVSYFLYFCSFIFLLQLQDSFQQPTDQDPFPPKNSSDQETNFPPKPLRLRSLFIINPSDRKLFYPKPLDQCPFYPQKKGPFTQYPSVVGFFYPKSLRPRSHLPKNP